MILKKIYNFIKRRVKREYEKRAYYIKALNELLSKVKNNYSNIWFIGSADYNNIGDLAISYATTEFLKDINIKRNIIDIRLSDYYKYFKAIKKLIKPNDIIVLQGGGNMGFAYFEAESNRRDVINNFKKNKIIIFPSTIDYGTSLREKYELKKSIKIYSSHNDLTICARENKSYNKMKEIYGKNNILLFPDIVLSLELEYECNEKNDIICVCLRNDQEKRNESKNFYNYFINRKDIFFTDNIAHENDISIERRTEIFKEKLKYYSNAKLVITDRLHVMIFCAIIGKKCLFLDNKNAKISGVYNLWIKNKCNYIKPIIKDIDIEKQIEDIMNVKQGKRYKIDSEFDQLMHLFNEKGELKIEE